MRNGNDIDDFLDDHRQEDPEVTPPAAEDGAVHKFSFSDDEVRVLFQILSRVVLHRMGNHVRFIAAFSDDEIFTAGELARKFRAIIGE